MRLVAFNAETILVWNIFKTHLPHDPLRAIEEALLIVVGYVVSFHSYFNIQKPLYPATGDIAT